MTKVNINIKKLNSNATIPTYGTEFSAGADLYACLENPITIEPEKLNSFIQVLHLRFLKAMLVLCTQEAVFHVRKVLLLLTKSELLTQITVVK